LRQLSEPPSSAAVVASQAGKQGSYFRRQASLPFPAAEAQGQQAPAAGAQEEAGQRGGGGGSVVERLVPDRLGAGLRDDRRRVRLPLRQRRQPRQRRRRTGARWRLVLSVARCTVDDRPAF